MLPLNECVGHCSTWAAYKGLMTDVPHILFEFSLEIITAPFVFVAGKIWARREHAKIDAEHGIDHDDRVKERDYRWVYLRVDSKPKSGGPVMPKSGPSQ